jgi:1,4-dihydroxy-2-naphthoate polyprenyltransferase
MTGIRIFVDLVRANFLPASVSPFIFAVALAYNRGSEIPPLIFFLALFGVISGHLAANAANNYCDYLSGADDDDTLTTPFFGGTKVISSGQAAPGSALKASAAFGSAAVLSGIAISLIVKNPIFAILAVMASFFAIQYTARPLRLSYRGMGEASIFFLFGPFLIAGIYYLFSGTLSPDIFLMSLIPAGLIFAVIICNEIPDAITDRKAGKNNLVVILGANRGPALYAFGVCLSASALVLGVMAGTLSPAGLVCLVFYLMNIKAMKIIKSGRPVGRGMAEAGKMSVLAHFLVTVATALVLVLSA